MYTQDTLPLGDATVEYELVVSRRARRITMRVLPGRGLVVTAPQGVNRKIVQSFVDSQRSWIDKSLTDIAMNTLPQYRIWPPRNLPLEAMGKRLMLSFANDQDVQTDKASQPDDMHLALPFNTDDKAAIVKSVAEHLKGIARVFLPPLLASQAHLHQLHYQKVSIRGQRTVWGSYSSSGTLSLNYKLLFLPRELVDYVVLHELAHTVHLDHSNAFWELLCRLNVNSRGLDKKLRKAGVYVPPWLELTG